MERATVKVSSTFRDFLKHIVSDPVFPIKSVQQLVTLTSMEWLKDFNRGTQNEKRLMIEQLKKVQTEAEAKNYLHNSREMRQGNEE